MVSELKYYSGTTGITNNYPGNVTKAKYVSPVYFYSLWILNSWLYLVMALRLSITDCNDTYIISVPLYLLATL
jgi:hypothetical protein